MTTSQHGDPAPTLPSRAAAIGRLVPISPQYATLPIQDGFNWTACIAGFEMESLYLVVFRSVRRDSADIATLIAHDDRAHDEARAASGLLYYFKGDVNERNECLSFCLWRNRSEALAAARLPLHRVATRLVDEMYVSYQLERYIITKDIPIGDLIFQPVPPERPPAGTSRSTTLGAHRA